MSGTSVPINGSNLRNRVAYTAVIDQENTNVPEWRAATFYSYDPHGNVDTLLPGEEGSVPTRLLLFSVITCTWTESPEKIPNQVYNGALVSQLLWLVQFRPFVLLYRSTMARGKIVFFIAGPSSGEMVNGSL
jgi:hypothetical protein